jgi:peroxiredoxin
MADEPPESAAGGSFADLPDDLPEPTDDGAADHLPGARLPGTPLPATDGTTVDPSALEDTTVLYCYPMTGHPDRDDVPSGWSEIPGARGCTPEACGFRDHHQRLQTAGVTHVYGVSVQSTAAQREARDRLDLPYGLLSDEAGTFADALDLPTFTVQGERYLSRLTIVAKDGLIDHVFYPVFPPDEHAGEVLDWLREAEADGTDEGEEWTTPGS